MSRLLNGMNGPMVPQQPMLNISAPFNDVQTVALLASFAQGETPQEKVAAAQDLLVEAFRTNKLFNDKIDKVKRGDE